MSALDCKLRSTYDVEDSQDEQDLSSRTGFFKLLLLVLCLQEGALYYGGHPCSSMVWICRVVNQRSRMAPWGDELAPSFLANYRILQVLWLGIDLSTYRA